MKRLRGDLIKSQNIIILTVLAIIVGRCAYYGPVEARFILSPESRLPKWFTLSEGLRRSDVLVKVVTRTPILINSKNVEFILIKKNGDILADYYGITRIHPRTTSSANYPNYSIDTVNGVSEVLEQRRANDILYVSDDPALIAEINSSNKRGR